MKKNQDNPKKAQELPENDHRTLGQKLDLFSFHDVSPGAPFWHHNGMIIFRELERYARTINDEHGYQEINTPILVKKEVFEKSGHWEHYRDNMFWFNNPRDKNETLVIKPMNCPESTFIYNAKVQSYKDLPLRLAEIGRVHRNERSGTLGGLFRVRQLTMDDAHIFVQPDQVAQEVEDIIETIERFYGMFNFTPRYILATRPKKALGTKKDWTDAEEALTAALKKKKIDFIIDKGEGAFYGPKIEVHMNDAQGRDWQLGTAQLDLVMLPKQFKLSYVDEQGNKQMPWVIHRAIFGSFERVIGVLLEHFNGALPFWLAPIQAVILPVNKQQNSYAENIVTKLRAQNIRVELSHATETLGKRIREAETKKIPYILVVGEREAKSENVAVRERSKGDIGQMNLEDFLRIVEKKRQG